MGDVIINIDPILTYRAFADIASATIEDMRALFRDNEIFREYESGKMNSAEFRNKIRELLQLNLQDHEIDTAWNSMLLDVPKERVELLLRLKQKYEIFLLSNTNAIHTAEVVKRIARWHPISHYHELFHKAYLSHEIGLIKPDKKIYEYIIQDCSLKKENSIFFDDNKDNVESANQAGLTAIQVTREKSITDLLKYA